MSEQQLGKVKAVFEELLSSTDGCLPKARVQALAGEDYDAVRSALLATEKVEAAAGRAGGIALRRVQGNRREWNDSAEAKARRHLDDLQAEPEVHPAHSDNAIVDALKRVHKRWPQGRIAEALNVSQATVSNWLRSGNINSKYLDSITKLCAELESTKPGSQDDAQAHDEDSPYAQWLRAELERQQINAVTLAEKSGVHIATIVALLDGRTEKPQQRTRQRIEKALRSAGPDVRVAEQVSEAETWYYIGLPWTHDEIEQVPDDPGVYIIHDRLGRPAYVGVAHRGAGGIRARLKKHNELRWTSDTRVASSFSYALAGRMPRNDPSELAKALEKLLIKFMGNAILINERDVADLQRE